MGILPDLTLADPRVGSGIPAGTSRPATGRHPQTHWRRAVKSAKLGKDARVQLLSKLNTSINSNLLTKSKRKVT